MWPYHLLERHICAVLLFFGGITMFASIRNNNTNSSTENFLTVNNANEIISNNRKHFVKDVKLSNSSKNHFDFQRPRLMTYENGENVLINILGLFELDTKWGKREEGYSEMAAARLAVNHINKLKVLPGYLLRLISNDTKCDPGVGIDRFFHAIYSNSTITMLLGTSCSNVTESLANIMPYWNILQVSYGSTSPVLSDRNKFPLFFRTVAPDSSHNTAKIMFIKHFGWNTVATITLSQQPYLLLLNNFVNELEAANVTCVATITFSLDNMKEQLRALKELDTRVIIGSFSAKITPKILCEVYNLNMYGRDYVWILQDHEISWKGSKDCSERLLNKVMESLIFISDYNALLENETSISNLTTNLFELEMKTENVSISKYAPQSYDAVWAMALSMRNSLICKQKGFLKSFDYKNVRMADQFISEMDMLHFVGISGSVRFNGADRIGNSAFKQIQGGNLHDIAIYHAEGRFLDFHCRECFEIKWPGGHIPIAQRILKYRLVTIPKPAFYLVFLFSTIGIVASLIFLYFNLRFRRVKTVKLSSPRLNNIAVLGCILVYLAVILLVVDQDAWKTFLKKNYSHLCTVRVYLLSAGFLLTFGSIFAKTYRVHRIFICKATSLIKDRLLKDKQLIALIFMLLVVDGLIILLWAIVDPMENKLKNLSYEISSENRNIVYQPQIEVCRSRNTTGWLIAINSYKGFLLIMGIYMAWETRHVKIPSLDDSEYIGICVYSVVSSAIVVVLSNLISDYTTLSYLATALSILLSTTITLVLLFFPKLKTVLGHGKQQDDVVTQSMGLKTECNTRRFMLEDNREILYRLEVQNRVYKSEIQALDKEIARLEEQIATSTSSNYQSPLVESISNRIAFLPIPFPTTSRASWPPTNGTYKHSNTRLFHSEDKLNCKASNENFSGKRGLLERLQRIFGSISSVWISPSRRNYKTYFSRLSKPRSNPEFYKNQLIDAFEIVKAESAMYGVNCENNQDFAI